MEPAFIEFNQDRGGQFGFVAVRGWTDLPGDHPPQAGLRRLHLGGQRRRRIGQRPRLRTLTDEGTLNGRVFFHLGDDSAFQALPDKTQPAAKRPRGDDDERSPDPLRLGIRFRCGAAGVIMRTSPTS
jgi:hypothetical protein